MTTPAESPAPSPSKEMTMRARTDDAGPSDPVVTPSLLVEDVERRLMEAGVSGDATDQVTKIIEAWERSQTVPEPRDATATPESP